MESWNEGFERKKEMGREGKYNNTCADSEAIFFASSTV